MLRHGHAAADLRNLALHRAALSRLRESPDLRACCLTLVDAWLSAAELDAARPYLLRWREMLAAWPDDRIANTVLDPDEGQALRQCSPLAPALTPRERWAVLRDVNDRIARGSEQPDP